MKASKCYISHLEKLVRDFGAEELVIRLTHLVNWKWTSLSTIYGVLGIGSLSQKNSTLLMKWLWRFCHKENALWRKVISAIYGVDEHGWSSIEPRDKRSFRLWNGILKEKYQRFSFTDFVVADGRHITSCNSVP